MDAVQIVQIILGYFGVEAEKINLYINEVYISYSSEGIIGAIELTLEHYSNIGIKLTENSLISDYRTTWNEIKIIIIPNSEKLLSINGQVNIIDILATNSKDYISLNTINNPSEFNLSNA